MAEITLKNDENKIKTILDYYMLTNKLKDLIRTGWKRWGIKKERVESVAEHIYGTCMLALAIWSETLPEVNISEVLLMLALHETEEIDDAKKKKLKEKGQQAVEHIFKDFVAKDVYLNLVKQYNEGITKEAVFAKKCDKLECDIQARLYSDQGTLCLENADDIKENKAIKELRNKGITDVANFFILVDREHFKEDDIFLKINKYLENNHLIKQKSKKINKN